MAERVFKVRRDEDGRVLGIEFFTRTVPGHIWFRAVLSRNVKPGHRWMYSGVLRRDTFSYRGWGLIVMRLPSWPALHRRLGSGAQDGRPTSARLSPEYTGEPR